MTSKAPTHLSGENLQFIEQLYAQYLADPTSVDASWLPLFEEYLTDSPLRDLNGQRPTFPARSIFSATVAGGGGVDEHPVFEDKSNGTQIRTPGKTSGFAANVESLARAYRLHGHTAAGIDPLLLDVPELAPELHPSMHGLTDEDLKAAVHSDNLFGGVDATVGEVLEQLKRLYCGPIGVEYQNISDPAQRQWLRAEIEEHNYSLLHDVERQAIMAGLTDADAFETYLHRKYVGVKRFSLSGGDALIPMLRAMLEEAGELELDEVLIGMAHRGRLNVLHNIMGKRAENMFSEFEKTPEPEEYIGSSDVKYHMGYSSDYTTRTGKEIHLSLAFNPSHLEFVSPVVIGRARAKQDRRDVAPEIARKQIMPLLLHGDAAFSGQGIVAETLNLSQLRGYAVGGSVHVVINNQIGFTTLPVDSRSTRYATDLAKLLEAPIFHVNGNDPEACVRVSKLAVRYRQMFGRDVIIDLVCYRQYGHNEGDEPRYTQPIMYGRVDATTNVREVYAKSLAARKVMSEEEIQALWDARWTAYDEAYERIKEAPLKKQVSSGDGVWKDYKRKDYDIHTPVDTRVSLEVLQELGRKLALIPDDVNAHRTIRRIFKKREAMASGEEPLDWGMGEGLAFASLLVEGASIRMTGQDVVRGTFSHRHAAVFDGTTGEPYWPANHLAEEQGELRLYNSLLSEAAVLGFEYGYSLDFPDALVIWEAQFGDFVNGAQVIIDQFINSGEDKWKRFSGLTMLLPHGYEGQGPEHSSARLERFLQLCAEDNMFVCNLTTPAQIFHALRRQIHMPVRKPLIVTTPKSLLRLREATSSLDELVEGAFQHVIADARPEIDPAAVRRVALCSGKVYYDLVAHAAEHDIKDVAIVRVEQLYPLHHEALREAVAPYQGAEIVWVQEEPKNMGSWYYIFPELVELFGASPKLPRYVGREASASPATGDPGAHEIEQQMLVREALT